MPKWLRRLPKPWAPVPEELREDVGQDVLRSAVESLPRYDPAKATMIVWLYRITARMARDACKRDRVRARSSAEVDDLDDVATTHENPEDNLAEAQHMHLHMRLLRETLHEMRDELREVLEAYEFGELTLAEVAELIGIPKRTAKDRLDRARKDFERRIRRKVADTRGAVIVPITADALFEFVRARTSDLSAEEVVRLRAIVEEAPASGFRPAAEGTPSPNLPDAAPTAAGTVGGFVAGTIMGSLLGGVVVFLLMSPDAPMPQAEHLPPVGAVVAEMPSHVDTAPPESTASVAARPAPGDDKGDDARSLLAWSLRALNTGNIAEARSALGRYDQRFPADPLPKARSAVVEKLARAQRKTTEQ